MPAIPLGLQSYARMRGYQPETQLVNMYVEKDESGGDPDQNALYRLQRPGLLHHVTLPAPVRGMFQNQNSGTGEPYVAAGPNLYRISGGLGVSVGTISNDGLRVPMCASNFGLGLVSSGSFYYYNYTTLSIIALPDGANAVDIETINSYFIVAEAGGKFYWTLPGATTIDALDFANAEANPDGIVGVKRLGDQILFFGTQTIEIWDQTTDPEAPFRRAAGRTIDRGCMGRDTIQPFDNTLLFVGNDGVVYRVSTTPEAISTFGIEERIRKRTGVPSAFVFSHEGHKFYCLRIPGQGTFGYDAATKIWSEFSSYGQVVWKPHISIMVGDTAYCGDSDTGKIWVLDADTSTDDGGIMERLVTGTLAFPGKPIRKDSFAMLVGCSGSATIKLRWADGLNPFNGYVSLPCGAGSKVVTHRRLGWSQQPTCTFEVSCTDPVQVRMSGAMLNEAWQ